MNFKPILRHVARLGVALATIATFVLAGCGGGGGASSGGSTPANITGRFVDATVVGIAYKCGTSTAVAGLTNANGEYTCPSGQAVAFYVGDILIGQVSSPLAVITPLDMVGAGATPSNTTVANIVRFLMSISSTVPATGTITIDPAVATAAAGLTADFTAATNTALDALIPTLKPGATIYTSAQATAHVSASIFGLFANNYAGTYTGSYSGSWTVTIAADGTVTGLTGGAPINGAMMTTLSTGSTYGFSGTAGGVPWVGTLNVSTKVFSGTWNNGAGGSGTWTGTVDSTPPVTTPTVTGFSPTSGAVGTTVTITGTNLGLGFQPAPIVKFGTTTVTTPLTFNGQTSVSFAVPAGLAANTYTLTISGATDTPITVGTFNVTAAAGGVVPAAPTGVTGIAASATQIDLSWTAVSGATSYNIYKSTSTGVTVSAANKINTSNVTALAFSSTGLFGATPYFFKVSAVNAAGESVGSVEATVTTSAIPVGVVIPAAPDYIAQTFAIQATAAGIGAPLSTQIKVWGWGVAGGGSYNIYRSTAPGVAVTAGNLINSTPYNGVGFYTDNGLTAATKYYYKFTAVNAAGESPASPELATVTPLATVGAGAGLTLTPAFGGLAAMLNSIPYQGGYVVPVSSAFPLASTGMDMTYYDSVIVATPAVRSFIVSYRKDSANTEFIQLTISNGTTKAELDVPAIQVNVATVAKRCTLAVVSGETACSSIGITLNRVAGTVAFVNTPMIGATATAFSISGSYSFTPF